MGTVNLNDRLDDSLFYFLHSVKFFVKNTACLYRVDGFKVIILPLDVHHNGQCSLCMSSFFLRDLMGTCYGKVSSCPEADVIRHGPSRTGHKVCDALDTGELHVVALFILVLVLWKFCRCIACEQTLDHKLKKSILCRKLGAASECGLSDLVDCIAFSSILS